MSRTFIVIAHARTGSTFICQQLGDLADARVYFELFHNDLEQTRRFLGENADPVWDRFQPLAAGNLRDYLADHPLDLLNFLSERTYPDEQIFKLFPNHLNPDNVRAVLEHSSGVLMLHRNLLHSFLSHEIAMQTQKWVNDNTSDHKVAFDTKRFTGYIRFITGFYARVETILNQAGIAHTDILYEDVLTHPERIETKLALALAGVGATLRTQRPDTAKLRRQDSRPLASEKVSNPDELLDFLARLGLGSANDGTIGLRTARFGEALAQLS